MNMIRPLDEADFDAFLTIFANAYPGLPLASEEARQRLRQRLARWHTDTDTELYGLFREGRLLGGVRFVDFTMNLLSVKALAGGLALVAVDLPHKKEKVARDMVLEFLRHYRERGACLTLLYPFRLDFYKKMGFGYGAPMRQYRVRPDALPKGPSKARVRFLSKGDAPALVACYNRHAARTHGMLEKTQSEAAWVFDRPEVQFVGVADGNAIQGYLAFAFERAHERNFICNDLHIREFIYEDREALSELLTFLHSQADQVNRIIINTQDEFFHHLLADARDGTGNLIPHAAHQICAAGLGIMYRVTDVRRLFQVLESRTFGGQTCTLKLTVTDSFLPENDGSVLVRFVNGRAQIVESGRPDAEVRLDIAEFSSLIMGVVPFRALHHYGLADISDPAWADAVERIFAVETKPVCTTVF